MKLFEKGPGFQSGLADLPKHLNGSTISAGLISTVFGCTGPCLVTVAAANAAGFTLADTVTWVFGIYVFGGLLGTILALYYKIPVSGAYSIPGATLMGTALAGYSFNEAAGAFIIAGVIVLIIGLSGAIGKIMQFLPLEIVMAMVGGAMMKFGSGIVTTTQGNPVVCGAAVLAFFLVPRIIKKCPAVVAALIAGFAAALVSGQFTADMTNISYIAPRIVAPAFNGTLILSCSIPLAALVMGAENAQAMGVLRTEGYLVHANTMTVTSGIGGIISCPYPDFFFVHQRHIGRCDHSGTGISVVVPISGNLLHHKPRDFRLFFQFPPGRIRKVLPQIYETSRQRPCTDTGMVASLHQQNAQTFQRRIRCSRMCEDQGICRAGRGLIPSRVIAFQKLLQGLPF